MDQSKKTMRHFYCRDVLWETFEQMANDFDCSIDYLINESMRFYARSKNYQAGTAASSSNIPAQAGNGPAAVEFDTERFFGHFEGDPQRYRGDGEIERIRETRDCLKTFREKVTSASLLSDADIDAVDREVLALIDEVVEAARAAERPTAEDVLTDVYISY